jgi:hypothetical protein
MRTKLLSFVLALVIFTSCAMSYQAIKFDQPYSKVFEDLPGNKNQLFVKANEWMIKTFISAQSVIQYSDKEEGALIGKYLLHGTEGYGSYAIDTRIFAKIDIRIKDNKAMITIEPLSEWNYDSSGMTIFNYSKEKALADIDVLSSSLQAALLAKTIEF